MSAENPKSSAPSQNYSLVNTIRIFIFPALGGVLFGYDIGATSVDWGHYVSDSSFLQGLITSMVVVGALVGSTIMFSIADSLGRRNSLIYASVLYFLGAILEHLGGVGWVTSVSAVFGLLILLIGRFVYGVGVGFAMHGAPAYIGEMAPSSIRGLLISLKEAFIVLGMVTGYGIGAAYANISKGWGTIYLLSTPLAVLMNIGLNYLPYSARWLALQGRVDEACVSLKFVSPDMTQAQIDAIIENASASAATSKGLSWADLLSESVRPAIIAGIGVVFLQQVTGQPSVLYYADTIFKQVGIGRYASVAVSIFKLVMTLVATITVDKYGRKILLFIGCGVMLIAWLFISEIFPLEVRGKAVSLAVVTNFGWNAIMSLIFPVELDYLGASFTFFIYSGILVFGIFFIHRRVPETKGLTLEEIEQLFLRMQSSSTKSKTAPTLNTPLINEDSIA
eukprot:GSChrysophyteH1.ASY1.ANO1.845.1 assembled CDS